MDLAELSVKRPVLVTVFSIIIVLFGLIGFNYLGVREFPSVDPPVITVRTSYTGANADVIQSQITEPLEKPLMVLMELEHYPPHPIKVQVLLL
jgi:multidrug efflux pump subunit AcrB